ncbi:MAG: peptidylprolyl isomerase, partial [Bacteroidaceae bacterium]|nr:peptidylprolyl isomerase [Bacteroidaceae bacterium]
MPTRKILCLLFFFAVLLSSGVEAKKKDKRSIVRIETNAGVMRVALFDDTPLHRDNFLKLAESKFYDGLLFHRVIKDFMIQAG